jgi:hypothetical protein
MKSEKRVSRLILKKETLQDLTARHAEQIKGGSCSLLGSGRYTKAGKTCAKSVCKKCG